MVIFKVSDVSQGHQHWQQQLFPGNEDCEAVDVLPPEFQVTGINWTNDEEKEDDEDEIAYTGRENHVKPKILNGVDWTLLYFVQLRFR